MDVSEAKCYNQLKWNFIVKYMHVGLVQLCLPAH